MNMVPSGITASASMTYCPDTPLGGLRFGDRVAEHDPIAVATSRRGIKEDLWFTGQQTRNYRGSSGPPFAMSVMNHSLPRLVKQT
jgi:hypothetical protein